MRFQNLTDLPVQTMERLMTFAWLHWRRAGTLRTHQGQFWMTALRTGGESTAADEAGVALLDLRTPPADAGRLRTEVTVPSLGFKQGPAPLTGNDVTDAVGGCIQFQVYDLMFLGELPIWALLPSAITLHQNWMACSC